MGGREGELPAVLVGYEPPASFIVFPSLAPTSLGIECALRSSVLLSPMPSTRVSFFLVQYFLLFFSVASPIGLLASSPDRSVTWSNNTHQSWCYSRSLQWEAICLTLSEIDCSCICNVPQKRSPLTGYVSSMTCEKQFVPQDDKFLYCSEA